MRRPQEILPQQEALSAVRELTSVFEGIASLRISQIKNQVLQAQQFFEALWNIYTQIRVDTKFRYGRSQSGAKVIDKELIIIITAEGGLSGDIDQKLIDLMLKNYNKDKNDVIVVGHHGAQQLTQAKIPLQNYFKMPENDQNINTEQIIQEVQRYRTTTIYYQSYVSLMVQEVKRITLSVAVQEKGQNVKEGEEIISEDTYIFEPSTYSVVDHLERSMLQIAVSEVVLESKLAQYASRFKAMSVAHNKADESMASLTLMYNRSVRATKDERLREIMNAMHKAKVAV
jgi:F-type H+-transporting ATPase subunit gamma